MAATGQVETNLHVHIGRKNALKKVVNLLELYLQVKTQKTTRKTSSFYVHRLSKATSMNTNIAKAGKVEKLKHEQNTFTCTCMYIFT